MSRPREVSPPWCVTKRDRWGFVVEAVVLCFRGQITRTFDDNGERMDVRATAPNAYEIGYEVIQ